MKMNALVMEAYKQFQLREVEVPQPRPGQVLVRVRACAVCGSDVHGIDGSTGRRQPPIVMGHEAAGEIAQLGEGVKGWAEGDRVTFDSTVYCGECDACRAGKVNLCAQRRVLGVSCDDYHMDGAFAQYLVVPAYILYRLPDSVSFQQAAMVEPLSIACHAARQAPVPQGGTVAVVGVGTIGLLLTQVLRSMGAGRVIAVDIDEGHLDKAMSLGAAARVNSSRPDAVQAIRALTPDGQGVDAAYDCTGIDATFNLCLQIARLDAAVVLVGNLQKNLNFPLQWVVTRQQKIFGSCASAGEYPQCLDMIARGQVDVDALISRAVPLAEGAEWILRLYQRESGLYKIVLLP